jgi:hypothetical protein
MSMDSAVATDVEQLKQIRREQGWTQVVGE